MNEYEVKRIKAILETIEVVTEKMDSSNMTHSEKRGIIKLINELATEALMRMPLIKTNGELPF